MCTSYHITLFFLAFVKKELARSSVKNKSRRLVKIKIDVRKMGKEWRNFFELKKLIRASDNPTSRK